MTKITETTAIKAGDKVRCTATEHDWLTVGKVYEVLAAKGDKERLFGRKMLDGGVNMIDDNGVMMYVNLPDSLHGRFELVEEYQTPCQREGYKIGDKFRVVSGEEYIHGSIITLYEDDGSLAPLFKGQGTKYKNANGQPGAYVGLHRVEKIDETQTEKAFTPEMPVETEAKEECDGNSVKKDDWVEFIGPDASPGYTVGKFYQVTGGPGDVDKACHGTIEKGAMNLIDDDGDLRFAGFPYARAGEFKKVEQPWLENTGTMPVAYGTLVDVEHRNGNQYFNQYSGEVHAEDWGIDGLGQDIIKWRLVKKVEEKSEKVVDTPKPADVVLPHQDETDTKEETKVDWKVGDKVRIKTDADYRFCVNDEMLKAQRECEVGEIIEVDTDRVKVKTPSFRRAYTFEGRELEKLTEQETTTMNTTTATADAVAPKLVPFCVDLNTVTARQMNELLTLAVGLGAHLCEAVYDDEMDEDDVDAAFPVLEGATKCDRENYNYCGVDRDNDTYTLDNFYAFNENILTYEGAKRMLLGNEATQTTKGAKTMTQQKSELKSFYVKLSEATNAEQVNALLNRLVAQGAELHDLVHDREEERSVREANPGYTGGICFMAAFNLFGLKKVNDKFLTYINDYKREWDDEAVEMTIEELETYLKALEGKGRKPKGRPLRQRKVQIVYTNDKGYLLKNVIGFDIKASERTVNITYKQHKGKVIHNNNIVIPFSELKSVKFVAPSVVGAEYIFKGGKVVQVIQDFTHEDFTHKSH